MKNLQKLLAVCIVICVGFSGVLNFMSLSSKHVLASLIDDELYVNHNALITNTPSVWVFAEIINNSTKIFRNVTVTITFYDDKDEIISSSTKRVWLEFVLPYRRAPIAASITGEEARNFSRYEINIENYEVEQIEIERNLAVNVETAILSDTNATIACTVFNNGTKPIIELILLAIFYNENGIRCVEGFPVKLYEPLNPGKITETIYISSVFINNNSENVACIVTAEARAVKDPLNPKEKIYYAMDKEILFWLKGERRTIHYVYVDGKPFYIETYSNSSIHDLTFSRASKKIRFLVSGIVPETKGFCNITIPVDLLNGPYTVRIDDSTVLSNYNSKTNGTHNFVYVTYNHNLQTLTVEIIGPQEVDFRIVITIILAVCIIAIVILNTVRRKKLHRTKRKSVKNR